MQQTLNYYASVSDVVQLFLARRKCKLCISARAYAYIGMETAHMCSRALFSLYENGRLWLYTNECSACAASFPLPYRLRCRRLMRRRPPILYFMSTRFKPQLDRTLWWWWVGARKQRHVLLPVFIYTRCLLKKTRLAHTLYILRQVFVDFAYFFFATNGFTTLPILQ